MSKWLREEEESFVPSLLIKAASRSAPAQNKYSVFLREIRVLNNRRLFGSADLIVYAVVVDGCPDMESRRPFWAHELPFFGIKDGESLAIDRDAGFLVYQGQPRDFLNVYFVVVRDTHTTGDFAKVLRENCIAQGVGTLVGAGISIYANLPGDLTVPATRDLVVKAVETTLDYFARRGNKVIGVYYGSLVKEASDYGHGLHPHDYPETLVKCGNALELAYEVRKDGD